MSVNYVRIVTYVFARCLIERKRSSRTWLFAPVASKGGGHSEADEHAAGDVTLPAQVATMVLDPSPSRARDQRIKSIARQAHQCEQQTEEGHLERHRAARGIDKLR